MKLLVLFACSVVVGCGVIFGLVHGLVPHLVDPTFFPSVQAREPSPAPLAETIGTAGAAVRTGAERGPRDLVADAR
ncbi:MAG TPA: hypothetical protein VGE74_32710 [Gemmata sp.]